MIAFTRRCGAPRATCAPRAIRDRVRDHGGGGPVRVRLLAAACGALLLVPIRATAQSDAFGGPGGGAGAVSVDPQPAPAPDAPAAPGRPPAANAETVAFPFPIRPIVFLGLGGHERDGMSLGADLGLRLAPLTVRWAYRVAFTRGGYVESSTGRLGWIFAENRWAAGYAGAGAGRLEYVYDLGGAHAGVTVFTAEAGVLLGARCWLGPLLGLHVEALAPRTRAPDPRSGTLAAPRLSAVLDVNLLVLIGKGQAFCP
jgi:hypothetical protein